VSARFDAALAEVGARTEALGIERDPTGSAQGWIVGSPDQLARRVVSGYVPLEDADAAMRFLSECAEAMLDMVARANSGVVAVAAMKMTLAQVLMLGVALERQEAE